MSLNLSFTQLSNRWSGRNRQGFSLVELIVVLVVIGILAAIAYVAYAALIKDADAKALAATAQSVDREAVALAAFDQSSPASKVPDVLTAGNGFTAVTSLSSGLGVTPTALSPVNVFGIQTVVETTEWTAKDGDIEIVKDGDTYTFSYDPALGKPDVQAVYQPSTASGTTPGVITIVKDGISAGGGTGGTGEEGTGGSGEEGTGGSGEEGTGGSGEEGTGGSGEEGTGGSTSPASLPLLGMYGSDWYTSGCCFTLSTSSFLDNSNLYYFFNVDAMVFFPTSPDDERWEWWNEYFVTPDSLRIYVGTSEPAGRFVDWSTSVPTQQQLENLTWTIAKDILWDPPNVRWYVALDPLNDYVLNYFESGQDVAIMFVVVKDGVEVERSEIRVVNQGTTMPFLG